MILLISKNLSFINFPPAIILYETFSTEVHWTGSIEIKAIFVSYGRNENRFFDYKESIKSLHE